MIHFDLPKQKSSIIKVVGVGGGGSNAVNFMFSQDVEGVDFIICNTDAKAIEQSKVPNKIQLGPHLTQGLGAGANPEVGRAATEESLEEIKRILEVNTKMAFITVGMGGGTGTGAKATIVVSGGGVTSVTVTTAGNGYVVGDVLSSSAVNIGGTGSGFSIVVSQVSGRNPVYNPVTSVQPQWSDLDIDNIIYLLLQDISINMRDGMLQQFAQVETQQSK